MSMPVKLKVVCLNLWKGGLLLDDIIKFLKQENPDLILLQEVFNGDSSLLKKEHRSLEFLQASLGYEHSHFAATFLENISDADGEGNDKKIEQGNAILSKFPIEEKSIRFYDVPFGERVDEYDYYPYTPRNLQHVVVDLGVLESGGDSLTKKLHVLNTQGIWGTHGDDTDRRLKMGELIVDEVGDNAPLLLAGDLNVDINTETIKKIENVLESVFKDKLKTSFNLSRKDLLKDPGYATSAVDMMFVSKDIRVIDYSCPNVDVSDHLPLVLELEI